MATITGYLNQIKERPTKFGTYYILNVDGKDYDTGSKFPIKGASVGDYVSFELRKKDNGYEVMVQGSLAKAQPPAGVTPAKAAAAVAAASGPDRQEVISKQAALNSALTMAQLLVAAGGVPQGAKATPAAIAEKLEAIVLSYRARFYKDATGSEWPMDEEDVAQAVAATVDWASAE